MYRSRYPTDDPDPRIARMARALLHATVSAEDRLAEVEVHPGSNGRVKWHRMKQHRDELKTALDSIKYDEAGTLPMVLF